MTSAAREQTVHGEQAREDWERRIYRRLTDTADVDPALALPAPREVRAQPGAGHVRLDWEPVPGAAGYLVERTGPDRKPLIVAHGGSDVAAVARPPFADTGIDDDTEYDYRVGAVLGADYPVWAWSEPAHGHTLASAAADVQVAVDSAITVARLDRVWRMVGSERLTQLAFGDDGNGNDIGAEFAEALGFTNGAISGSACRATTRPDAAAACARCATTRRRLPRDPADAKEGLSQSQCAPTPATSTTPVVPCTTETTVTPHASFLALSVIPQQAYANIQKLHTLYPGVYTADGGFYDAVDPTTGAIGHRRLVLDQSMIMAALDNALTGNALQKHFAGDPTSWAAHTYLAAETMSIH